jgi:CspA family cold shock protein
MNLISTDDNTLTPSLNNTNTNTQTQRGRVKWFNNKAGYGFITIFSDLDVFVHHSSIKVENQQYKYLVQGEYVEFNLVTVQDSKHKFQASDVCGINGGKLMCETRREFRISRTTFKNPEQTSIPDKVKPESILSDTVKIPKQVRPRPSRVRGEGPRDAQKSDWTEVKKVRKTPVKYNKVLEEK